jgi:CspA family cold shock protein
MSGTKTGTVKFFNKEKGFGFIKENGSGTEYFVHTSGLKDEIREKDEVTFNTKQGKKGVNAIDVQIAE